MKIFPVIWTAEALRDLDGIFDFLSSKSPGAAGKTVLSVLSRAKQLEKFPESGQVQEVWHTTKISYRYLIESNYKIIYSIQKQIIHIHTVFDCRQDPEKLQDKFQ